MSDEILGFTHLWTVTAWRAVAREQLGRLLASGLAAATDRIFVSLAGPEVDAARLLYEHALGERFVLARCSPDAAPAERPLLERARRICAGEGQEARAVWYVHGKGVSPLRVGNPGVADWRELLEHFVIDRWRDCLDALGSFDVCGVNWTEQPAWHFSGNFWWARPNYLATLPERIGRDYLDPELWIGRREPRVRCLHQSHLNHYTIHYPTSRYREDQPGIPSVTPFAESLDDDALLSELGEPSATFLRAQRARVAGELPLALDAYTRRILLGGWAEEVFYARLQRARLLEALEAPGSEVVAAYLDAWRSRPGRAEPLFDLARRVRRAGIPDLGYLFARRAVDLPVPLDDALYVEADGERWWAVDELAACAADLGLAPEGRRE